MNFGKWFGVVLVWLGCGLAAQAQMGAYIGYSATHFSGITCLSTTVPCSNGTAAGSTGVVNPSGVFLGAFYDFRDVGPVRLGVDARYMHDRSDKSASDFGGSGDATESNTFLLGLRGSVKTPISWLKPYAEVAGGYTSSNLTEPFCATNSGTTFSCGGTSTAPRQYDDFFRYEGFVGADIRIASVLDLRAIEVGFGNMDRFGTGTAGTSTSVGLRSIGAGLVFHLPSK